MRWWSVAPTAKATIAAIDVAEAQAAPGVLAIVTHANADRLPGADPKDKPEPGDRVLQVLQDDRVLYDDQPVAVVVANTLDRARHAAALVKVTYQGIAQPTVTFDQKSPSLCAGQGQPRHDRFEPRRCRAGAARRSGGHRRHVHHAGRESQPDGDARHHRGVARR